MAAAWHCDNFWHFSHEIHRGIHVWRPNRQRDRPRQRLRVPATVRADPALVGIRRSSPILKTAKPRRRRHL